MVGVVGLHSEGEPGNVVDDVEEGLVGGLPAGERGTARPGPGPRLILPGPADRGMALPYWRGFIIPFRGALFCTGRCNRWLGG